MTDKNKVPTPKATDKDDSGDGNKAMSPTGDADAESENDSSSGKRKTPPFNKTLNSKSGKKAKKEAPAKPREEIADTLALENSDANDADDDDDDRQEVQWRWTSGRPEPTKLDDEKIKIPETDLKGGEVKVKKAQPPPTSDQEKKLNILRAFKRDNEDSYATWADGQRVKREQLYPGTPALQLWTNA
ncbi:hypothetical protein KC316_g570 [Hortaea werneckii]|nr:hypothetical protein KC324_g595 [Hortaea werneckii]KAI7595398.1 hypothetical protein KC316_g570 [Hortaea werneckii]